MFRSTRAAMLAVVSALCVGSAAVPAQGVKVKAAAAPVVSKDDIDLWAFSTVSSLAPGKTTADFRALPNLAGETKDDLRGLIEDNAPAEARVGPVSYRFTYADGLDINVLDYGASAFVTRLRIKGADRVVKDDIKIGGPRSQIEAVLGRPTRGGGSYAVYEGKTDEVRVFYTPAGTVSAVEVDRGS